jgi:hypothetical protein
MHRLLTLPLCTDPAACGCWPHRRGIARLHETEQHGASAPELVDRHTCGRADRDLRGASKCESFSIWPRTSSRPH